MKLAIAIIIVLSSVFITTFCSSESKKSTKFFVHLQSSENASISDDHLEKIYHQLENRRYYFDKEIISESKQSLTQNKITLYHLFERWISDQTLLNTDKKIEIKFKDASATNHVVNISIWENPQKWRRILNAGDFNISSVAWESFLKRVTELIVGLTFK